MDPLVRRKIGRTNVEVTQLGFGGAGLGDLSVVVEDANATQQCRECTEIKGIATQDGMLAKQPLIADPADP